MRLVQFTNTDSVVSYPHEGVSAFGGTDKVGDLIVGEYNGSASEADLAPYTGAWPIPLTDAVVEKEAKQWRDKELIETDTMAQHLPDHSGHTAWKNYRISLRDWPSTADFPATKPTLGS